jgi:pimeloyl-ACP methyl ester carboxylesterase
VMDSGLGGTVLDWQLVQPEVAKFARVCTYDRAGMGWSEAGSQPRTSEQIVRELHALLGNAGVEGPYVLVGHSFGGTNLQVYASRYPDEVAAMVLVVLSWVAPGVREAWSFNLLGGMSVGLAMVSSAFLFWQELRANRQELRAARQESRDISVEAGDEWSPKAWLYAIAFGLSFVLSWFLLPHLFLS